MTLCSLANSLICLNLLTEAALLCAPVPRIRRLRLPSRRKLGLVALLSSGGLVSLTAILRAAVTLSEKPSTLNINRWGAREIIVGVVLVTVPDLCLLFTRGFWRQSLYDDTAVIAAATAARCVTGAGGGDGRCGTGRWQWVFA